MYACVRDHIESSARPSQSQAVSTLWVLLWVTSPPGESEASGAEKMGASFHDTHNVQSVTNCLCMYIWLDINKNLDDMLALLSVYLI